MRGKRHKSTKSVNAHDRWWKRWKWCRDRYEYSYSREKHVASEIAKERIRSALIRESLGNHLLHDVTLIDLRVMKLLYETYRIFLSLLEKSHNLFYQKYLYLYKCSIFTDRNSNILLNYNVIHEDTTMRSKRTLTLEQKITVISPNVFFRGLVSLIERM